MPPGRRNQSQSSPSSSLGGTLNQGNNAASPGGKGGSMSNVNNNNANSPSNNAANQNNRPQSPNEMPPVAAEWLSECPNLHQLPIPVVVPAAASSAVGSSSANNTPTPTPQQQQQQSAAAVATTTQPFNINHPLHPHYRTATTFNNFISFNNNANSSSPSTHRTGRSGAGGGDNNNTQSVTNSSTSGNTTSRDSNNNNTIVPPGSLHPSLLSVVTQQQANDNISQEQQGILSPILPGGLNLNNINQQQQQQLQLPSSTFDHLARTNQLTLLFQDKLYTWGGWFGCGTEKPPKETLCCYDLNGNTSVAPSANINQLGATGVTSASSNVASGNTPVPPSASTTVSPPPAAWSQHFIKTSPGCQQSIHPGVTQFAWAETAPGVAILFGGWTGTNRTNAVSVLCLTYENISNALLLQQQQQPSSTSAHQQHSSHQNQTISPSHHGRTASSNQNTAATQAAAAANMNINLGPVVVKWKTLETTGDKPPPLTFATGVCALGGKRFAVYGGNGAEGPSSDVYILDLTTLHWRQLPSAGCPPKRSSHSACVVRDSMMVVFGGRGVSDLSSLSLSDGLGGVSSLQNANDNTTNSKSSKLDAKAQAALLAAQQNQQQQALPQFANTPLLMNDFGVFDIASSHWQIGLRVEGLAPPARYGHTAVSTAGGNHIVIFGGIGDQGNLLNDCWVLSFDKPGTIVWRPVTHLINPRGDTPLPMISGVAQQQQQQQKDSHWKDSTPYQPTPRTGAGVVKVTKSIVAVVAGRTGPSLLEPIDTNSTSSANQFNNTMIVGKSSSSSAASLTTTSSSPLLNSKYPTSASVHFLDISRVVADEMKSGGGAGGRNSEVTTPQP